MDLKGINWVGHMYQKYETMLLEVEDDMYQDVVTYVESQVQTVGDSVKKFYSDVIQDLLPPSSGDPLDSDLPVEKTKASTKEVSINVNDERIMQNPEVIDVEVGNSTSFLQGLSSVNYSSASSSAYSLNRSCSEFYEDGTMHDYSSHDTKMNTEKQNLSPLLTAGAISLVKEGSGRATGFFQQLHESQEVSCDKMAISVSRYDEIEDASKYESGFSIDGPSADESMLERSIDNKVTEVRLSSCGDLSAESNDISSSNEMVSVVRSMTNGDARCCDITDKNFIASSSVLAGKEDDSDENEINNEDAIEPDWGSIQLSGHLKLEESCVVVNGDELFCVPQSKGKIRPYKKKIRDALTLRIKSARKEEYEQLAVWYADDAGSNHQCTKNLKPVLTMEKKNSSPKHDICESEWELL